MTYDRKYLMWALGYAIAGMIVGVIMAASHNHGQLVAHAHIMLVGFVVSLIYAVIHKLWLTGAKKKGIAKVQFIAHQAGAAVMSIGLLLLYGKHMPEATLDPFLAIASITILIAMIMMMAMVASKR